MIAARLAVLLLLLTAIPAFAGFLPKGGGTPSAGPATITDIVLTGNTVTAGSAGLIPGVFGMGFGASYVGNLHAITSSSAFNDNLNYTGSIGTYSLSSSGGCSGLGSDNASFLVSGTTILLTNGPITTSGGHHPGDASKYDICVMATQSGLASSPFPKQFTIQALNQSIPDVWLSGTTFAPGLSNALVGWIFVPVAPAGPPFNGTVTVSDTTHFQVIKYTSGFILATKGALPANCGGSCPYSITLTANTPGTHTTGSISITADTGPFATSQTFLPAYSGTDVTDQGSIDSGQTPVYGPAWVMRTANLAAGTTIGAVPAMPYPAYPTGTPACTINGGVDAAAFTLTGCTLKIGASPLPCPGGGSNTAWCRPITSMTFDGANGIDIVLPGTYTSPVSGTGQWIIISGATYDAEGDCSYVCGPLQVTQFTSSTQFKVATLTGAGAGSHITPGNLDWAVRVDETETTSGGTVAQPAKPNLVDVRGINAAAGTQSCASGYSSWTAPETVTLSDYVAAPGQTITATITNAANCNSNDQLVISAPARDREGGAFFVVPICNITTNTQTCTFTVPYPVTDDYTPAFVYYYQNNCFGSCGYVDKQLLEITPSQPYKVPTAMNTEAAPFTPAHTFYVSATGSGSTCSSGSPCGSINAALGAVQTACGGPTPPCTIDNVQVQVGQGLFMWDGDDFGQGYFSFTNALNMPNHLDIVGVGGDLPHLNNAWSVAGASCCHSKLGIFLWAPASAAENLWIRNLDIGDWGSSALSPNQAAVWILGNGGATMHLWNSYIHDGGDMGMITAEQSSPSQSHIINVDIDHSVFAREGGNNGPKHNIYFGSTATCPGGAAQPLPSCPDPFSLGNTGIPTTPVSTFSFTNSVSRQAAWGHILKIRGATNTVHCSFLLGGVDDVYRSSAAVEFPEDSADTLTNNVLMVADNNLYGGYGGLAARGDDTEQAVMPTSYLTMHDNIGVIDDPLGALHTHYFLFDWKHFYSNAPQTWSNDSWVGAVSGQTEHTYFVDQNDSGWSCGGNLARCSALRTDALPAGESVYPDRVAAGITKQFPDFPSAWGCGPVGNEAVP